MSTIRTFHAKYGRRGMELQIGDVPGLLDELEVYGSGLETDRPFDIGGPLVTRRSTSEWIVGWIKGMPGDSVGRSGYVWESWGVVTPAGYDILRWPWTVDILKAEPSDRSLAELLRVLNGERPALLKLPTRPTTLVPLLVKYFESTVAAEPPQQFLIPIQAPADIALLPWMWLVGPVAWEQATVGPPRRIVPTAITPLLSYEGHITADSPKGAGIKSEYLQRVVDTFSSPEQTDLWRQIAKLRDAPPDARLRLLRESASSARPATTSGPQPGAWRSAQSRYPSYVRVQQSDRLPLETVPPVDSGNREAAGIDTDGSMMIDYMSRHLRDLDRRVNILLAMVAFLVLAACALLWHAFALAPDPRSPAKAASAATTAPNPPESQAASAASPTAQTEPQSATLRCNDDLETPAVQALLRDATLRQIANQRLKISAGLAAYLQTKRDGAADRATDPQFSAISLTTLAAQISLIDAGCAPRDAPVDGVMGPTTRTLAQDCRSPVTMRIIGDANEAARWLCSWSTR